MTASTGPRKGKTNDVQVVIRAANRIAARLDERIRRLETAISWALGESPEDVPEFMPPPSNKAPYWWRTQLRALATDGVASVSPKGRHRPGAADEIERLRAAIDWRPIESAPKDGTTIELCAVMHAHSVQRDGGSWWRPETPQTQWCLTAWRKVKASDEGQAASTIPLPEPPKA